SVSIKVDFTPRNPKRPSSKGALICGASFLVLLRARAWATAGGGTDMTGTNGAVTNQDSYYDVASGYESAASGDNAGTLWGPGRRWSGLPEGDPKGLGSQPYGRNRRVRRHQVRAGADFSW
ncbi:MAG: hypothetical protein ACREKE_10425, partial [bacterium]